MFGVGLSPITPMMQNNLRCDQFRIIPGQRGILSVREIREGFEQITRISRGTRKSPEMRRTLQGHADHLGTVWSPFGWDRT